MKMLLLSLSFFCLLACQPQAEGTPKTSTPVAKAVVQKAKVPVQEASKKDSIPPANKTRYIVDTSRPATEIEKQFPFDISITNAEGEKLKTNTAFKTNGKPTVLLFWLTTCYPCRVELAAIKKEYPAWIAETDFNLYAISTDFQKNYDSFTKTVKKNNWPFPAFHDTHREFRKVMKGGLNGLPQVFLLDANGEVVYHKRKYHSGDEHTLYARVKALAKN